MDYKKIKTIIFDLGGVIIDIDFDLTYKAFSSLTNKPLDSTIAKFNELEVYDRYEKGLWSDREFIDFLKKELELTHLDDQAIIDAWNGLLLDLPAERIDKVRSLHGKYNLLVLSNTSPIHIVGVNKTLSKNTGFNTLEEVFDTVHYSYDLGLRKPGTAIYNKVIKIHGLNPAETLFLDDNYDNILGAQSVGIQTIHVQAPTTILDYLKDA